MTHGSTLQNLAAPRTTSRIQLTDATLLSQHFVDAVRPSWDAVAVHPFFSDFQQHDARQIRKAIQGFFGVIEAFPRLMAAVLSRLEPAQGPHVEEARAWLMRNIAVEDLHRRWWLEMGGAFGLSAAEVTAHEPTPAMEAPLLHLWNVARTAPLGPAIAAINYAIEGVTGDFSKRLAVEVPRWFTQHGLTLRPRALRWLEAHATYDDVHPIEALEIIKGACTDLPAMSLAAKTACRSLLYLRLGLDDALI